MRRHLQPRSTAASVLAVLAVAGVGCGGASDGGKDVATLPMTTTTPTGAQLVVTSTLSAKGAAAREICVAEQITSRSGQQVAPFCLSQGGEAYGLVDSRRGGAAHLVLAVPAGAAHIILDGNAGRHVEGRIARGATDDQRIGVVTVPKDMLPARLRATDGDGKTLVVSERFGAPTCRLTDKATRGLACAIHVPLHLQR